MTTTTWHAHLMHTHRSAPLGTTLKQSMVQASATYRASKRAKEQAIAPTFGKKRHTPKAKPPSDCLQIASALLSRDVSDLNEACKKLDKKHPWAQYEKGCWKCVSQEPEIEKQNLQLAEIILRDHPSFKDARELLFRNQMLRTDDPGQKSMQMIVRDAFGKGLNAVWGSLIKKLNPEQLQNLYDVSLGPYIAFVIVLHWAGLTKVLIDPSAWLPILKTLKDGWSPNEGAKISLWRDVVAVAGAVIPTLIQAGRAYYGV